jgi:hypothetical protein
MSRFAPLRPATTRPPRPATRPDRPHPVGDDTPRPARRKAVSVPWGVVGMLGLVIAIEGTVSRRWLDFSDPVSLSWRFMDRAARSEAAGCDVLFLGDSLVKHGLLPSVIRTETGLRSVNLSAARAPALMTYFVLRRALDAGARPSAIVIDTKPAVLIGGAEYNAPYWPAALSAGECLEVGRIAGHAHLGIALVTARMLPSLQSRLEVRSNIVAALNGTRDPIQEINRVLWRNWSVNEGANVASLNSSYRGELSPEIRERLHPDRWYVDPSNARGIERLLRLAQDRKIRVFWLLPPISSGLQEWRERSGAEGKFEEFVRSYQQRYPRVVTVLDARRVAPDPSLYVDATHLAGRGAVVLSHAVGVVLKAALSGNSADRAGEWIRLEPTTPDPPFPAMPQLEDVDRSKEIVRGGSG